MSTLSSSIRSTIGKTTQQALLGLLIIGTACILALTDRIDGPTFLALATPVVIYLFAKGNQAS